MALQVLPRNFLWLILICGCTFNAPLWTADSISAGNTHFDFSRLRYRSPQAYPSLAFEMLKAGDQVEAFLNLLRFRLAPSEETKVLFTIEDQTFEELIPIHEGGMRLRLSSETTQKLIQALQDGHKIGIVLNDFEEVLDPSQFSRTFAQFTGKKL